MSERKPPDPPNELEESGEFLRLPGLFVPKEIGPALVPGSKLRLELSGQAPDGTPLFAILARTVLGEPTAMERARRAEAAVRADFVARQATAGALGARSGPARDPPSRGELKARHREEHLCLKCIHHAVCGMAKGLDPALLVIITSCLAFEPADPDEPVSCELVPFPPEPAP